MRHRIAVGILAVVFCISTVQAEITGGWVEVDNRGLIPGFQTFDFVIETQSPWTGSEIFFQLTHGSFYQDPFGGVSTPNPDFFSLVPTLEFDTYVTDDGDQVNVGPASGSAIGGGGDITSSDTKLDLAWIFQIAPPEHSGSVRIARVSISDDAVGEWSVFSVSDVNDTGVVSGTVVDIFPEPASLVLLSSAAFVLLRRSPV